VYEVPQAKTTNIVSVNNEAQIHAFAEGSPDQVGFIGLQASETGGAHQIRTVRADSLFSLGMCLNSKDMPKWISMQNQVNRNLAPVPAPAGSTWGLS
jgi:hypothetical protein